MPANQIVTSKWYRGLRARVALFLSLAVLPIGLIAIFQTSRIAEEAERNTELALLALSDQAVQGERLIIQRASGAADMLGNFVPYLTENPDLCQPLLNEFLEREPNYSFVGVLPLDGLVTCSTSEEEMDFSDLAVWPDLIANPRPNVVMNPRAPSSKTAVLVVSMPFDIDEIFAGYISVSVPLSRLSEDDDFADMPLTGLVDLFTYNESADILMAENDLEQASDLLPVGFDLESKMTTQAQSFRDVGRNGTSYVYTVVPITDSTMTVVGVWDTNDMTNLSAIPSTVPAIAFPALMWIASVLVAMLALHTLVTRYITTLRLQMADFMLNRTVPATGFDGNAPNELVEIQSRFMDMTENILREEARLESIVREQKVLAKEVHHRVKNNLQMIASIMNMQIRNAEQTETVETLEKVQDRINALADVHKDLYTTQSEGRVNVGSLVNRTVQNSIELGVADIDKITLEKDIEDIWMFPDQVVALSLLASEAITNALKYISVPDGEKPTLTINLKKKGDSCIFSVSNTAFGEIDSGTGIGSKLMKAFSIKLGGTPEMISEDGTFTFRLKFPIAAFELESVDF